MKHLRSFNESVKEPIIEKKKLLCIKDCQFGYTDEKNKKYKKTVFFEGEVYDSTFYKNPADNKALITVTCEKEHHNFPFVEWEDSNSNFPESSRYIYDYFEII